MHRIDPVTGLPVHQAVYALNIQGFSQEQAVNIVAIVSVARREARMEQYRKENNDAVVAQ